MPRPAEAAMARRRYLRLVMIVLFAIVAVPFILISFMARSAGDRNGR